MDKTRRIDQLFNEFLVKENSVLWSYAGAPNNIDITLSPGERINIGIFQASRFMRKLDEQELLGPNTVVRVCANGADFPIAVNYTEADAVRVMEEVFAERQREYEASDKYIQDCADREKRVAKAREEYAKVMCDFRTDFSNLEMLGWLARYVPAIDKVGVHFDEKEMLRTFISMGYKVNDLVGDGEPDGIDANARYLVGQVMSFFQSGPFCHPMIGEWAEKKFKKYSAMKEHFGKHPYV